MEKNYIVKFEKVTKIYSNFFKSSKSIALDNMDFELKKGSITALIGPNGAGKTTTLKLISRFLLNYSGNIERNFSSFAYIPEEKKLYPNYTVEKIINFTNNLWKDMNIELQNKLINIFKLNRKKSFRDLSMGQKTGLYLAIELSRNVDLYILDEPTSSLDPIMKDNFFSFLKEYNIKYEKTFLIASHILEEMEELCDRIAIINKGKIVEHDDIDNLKEKYKKPLKEIFLSFFDTNSNF